jgi:predicted Zn-dependent protease
MSAAGASPSPARRAADALRPDLTGLWTIFGERLVHHEIHVVGRTVEIVRGPIELEGVSIALYRPHDGTLGLGNTNTNDLRRDPLRRALAEAEGQTTLSSFPAKTVELPGPDGPRASSAPTVDPALRGDPLPEMQAFLDELLAAYPEGKDPVPSFGSIRVTYGQSSVVNSGGLDHEEDGTYVEFEWAVKSSGGPEGRAPGEFWVNRTARRLDRASLGVDPARWNELARDVRRAEAPAGGELPVLFPPDALAEIIPSVLGFRLSGAAERRKMAFEVGSTLGPEELSIDDAPDLPWGVRSAVRDDEGTPTRAGALVERGRSKRIVYDALNGAALGHPPTGHSRRTPLFGDSWFRYPESIGAALTNVVIRPGSGGSVEELAEQAGEGILLGQLGYAFPDPTSGSYGGEIRIGYRIHRGKVAEPVRGGTVGGLVLGPEGAPSLLANVRAIGKEPHWAGPLYTPAILAGPISVAGPT